MTPPPGLERYARTRITKSQLRILTAFIEKHPQLNKGLSSPDFTNWDRNLLWREVSEYLNADGDGPIKTVAKWQKCWSDCKLMVKKIFQKTVANPLAKRPLTTLEVRILILMGLIPKNEVHSEPFEEVPLVENPKKRKCGTLDIQISSCKSVRLQSTKNTPPHQLDESTHFEELTIKKEPGCIVSINVETQTPNSETERSSDVSTSTVDKDSQNSGCSKAAAVKDNERSKSVAFNETNMCSAVAKSAARAKNTRSGDSKSTADAIFALVKELGVKNQLYKRQLDMDAIRLELETRKVMAFEQIANRMPNL